MSGNPVHILLVDDRPADLLALRSILFDPEYQLTEASSGSEALKRVLEQDFAVILLDVRMPGMDGFEVASIIKQRERSRHTPILFLTSAGSDISSFYRAYSVGAVDYLVKPVDRDVVRAKVAIFVELFRKDQRIQQQAAALREADRRERESQLTELRLAGEKRYHNLAEALPQIVWTAEADGAIRYWNRRWLDYSAMSHESSIGWGWLDAIHPADLVRYEEGWRKAIRLKETYQTECRLRRGSDGQFRYYLGRAVPELDAKGQVEGWIGTFIDFDDLKRAQAETEEAGLRSLFLAEASAHLSASLDHKVTLANVARLAVREFADCCFVDTTRSDGVPDGEPTAAAYADSRNSKSMLEFRRQCLANFAEHGLSHVLKSGKSELISHPSIPWVIRESPHPAYLEMIRSHGIKSVLMVPMIARGRILGVISFVRVQTSSGYGKDDLAMAEDLGCRAGIAVENARLYKEAQEAVEARDDFLSVASHELKTPLTSLDLQVQSLRRVLARQEAANGQKDKNIGKLDFLERQVDRLTKLIDDLLDVSRISGGRLVLEPQEADIAEIVSGAVARFGMQLTKAGCELDLRTTGTCPGRWDRLRLEQVVTNLLSNAVKYGAGKPIIVTLHFDQARARIVVRDHGIGIEKENQQRIFERFERIVSDRHCGGLGLGLWIVREIVSACGGTIFVRSDPRGETKFGEGSEFIVDLPREPRGEKAERKSVESHPQKAGQAGVSERLQ